MQPIIYYEKLGFTLFPWMVLAVVALVTSLHVAELDRMSIIAGECAEVMATRNWRRPHNNQDFVNRISTPYPVNSRAIGTLLTIIASLLSVGTGCSDPDWAKDVPGVYAGASPSFKEILELHQDGTYKHNVFAQNSLLASDDGKWIFTNRVVGLAPFTSFHQYYDPMTDRFENTPTEFGHYTYFPLPEGRTFFKLSASADYKFVLARNR